MEIPATVTTKGQITIPAPVRKALGLESGDRVVFRLVDGRALIRAENGGERDPGVELEKVPDLFALAGTVPVPSDVDPADWAAQREAAWTSAACNRM
ncbi:MAG TPA: type II toxin-antitoxin system PrlF family antitoxin [Chloroflexota bacterium]|nr:type II toxin-antitoxin system PrlF family antitoxin [Chloroflexota bacterium]